MIKKEELKQKYEAIKDDKDAIQKFLEEFQNDITTKLCKTQRKALRLKKNDYKDRTTGVWIREDIFAYQERQKKLKHRF